MLSQSYVVTQEVESAKVESGSKTAKDGFHNEDEIRNKFDHWVTDGDARAWLAAMNHDPAEIESVTTSKPHGEKADVEVTVRTKAGETVDRISIKLVSSPNGFNQIDKRWLANYAEMWNMPRDVFEALSLYVGETPPRAQSRDSKRMYLDELDEKTQASVVDFFSTHKDEIVSDFIAGDGDHAADWMMVTYKTIDGPRWVIRSSFDAIKYFGSGDVRITKKGNLKSAASQCNAKAATTVARRQICCSSKSIRWNCSRRKRLSPRNEAPHPVINSPATGVSRGSGVFPSRTTGDPGHRPDCGAL